MKHETFKDADFEKSNGTATLVFDNQGPVVALARASELKAVPITWTPPKTAAFRVVL
jgi:hypothetical protein